MKEEKDLFEQEIPVKEFDWKRKLLSLLCYVAVIALVSFLLVQYVVQRTVVSGNSMYPNLHHQDNVLVDKLSYRFREIERFDIVVFEVPYEKGTYYIKRIIGLPGETVQIKDGQIYINDVLLEEDYGLETMLDANRAAEPVTLGEEEYFVLGDNRNNSTDSRSPIVGNVHKSQIAGKAWVRIYPFNRLGILQHQ